jgi:hypothetical protein
LEAPPADPQDAAAMADGLVDVGEADQGLDHPVGYAALVAATSAWRLKRYRGIGALLACT